MNEPLLILLFIAIREKLFPPAVNSLVMISENVSEVKILQAILPSVSSSEIKQPVIRLVTADGNQMILSVVRSTHEHRHLYDVHLQCPSVFLLCQLRAAVCSKVTPTASRNFV